MSKLVQEGVARTLVKLAVPMLAGTFAISMYNLTNAWFVSRLGTQALAAISFTFPVVMLLMLMTRGLSSGSMTLVAHALGGQDRRKAATLATHALILTALFGLVLTIAGLATVKPLFSRLGASGEVLDLTARYMRLWYLGATVMALQIVSSDIIIGTGNTKAVSALMVGSTVVNVFLDMGLIFGMFGLPRLGIAGAAVATLLSQAVSLAAALYILGSRLRLVDLRGLQAEGLFQSWRRILTFAVPGAFGMILSPLSAAVVTRLVAGYGNAAVAAIGVASRIEMFAFMISMTVGIALMPFVAQNYGSGRMDRIRTARRGTMTFAVLHGLCIAFLFLLFARPLAELFSPEEEVIAVLCTYIRITCLGYGLLEVNRYAGFILTGVQEPLRASCLNMIRVFVLLIPLSLAGSVFFHLMGIFWARLATDVLAGMIGLWWSGRVLTRKANLTGTPQD